jgi:hypothetical protein
MPQIVIYQRKIQLGSGRLPGVGFGGLARCRNNELGDSGTHDKLSFFRRQ